ncbi:hypothetical protein LOTGIDRAFT_212296 [Lottia gigantea]|uniref:Uncharacterized protein n=1 Tax=Lottia gigantea TaxID=225164 RepID=V4B5F2_LOTGI|nr:hypothetical protein LOTGIDRAFT_212296 [Lottia gigantea]ESP02776.1 hypothetical protein LOTGIDRAFT_212296 [Lottia gigantea]
MAAFNPPPNQPYPPMDSRYPPVNQGYPHQGFTNQGYGPPGSVPPPPTYNQATAPAEEQKFQQQNAPQQNMGFGGPPGMPMPLPKMPAQYFANVDNNDSSSSGGNFEDGNNMASFSDKAVRRGFIKKVYLILMSQLLVTVGFVCLFLFVDSIKRWIQGPGFWMYWVSYGTFLVTYFALVCCPSVRRKYPGNFICLGIFTLAFSFMTGMISSFYDTNIVLMALGITAAVCLAISIFAIQTKIDFTLCSGLLFVLVMVLMLFGFLTIIMRFAFGYNRILDIVYASLAALVFGLFLIYDTQMIIGGRKHELSPEEYIYGALQLYVDVVYIFLIILSLFGSKN